MRPAAPRAALAVAVTLLQTTGLARQQPPQEPAPAPPAAAGAPADSAPGGAAAAGARDYARDVERACTDRRYGLRLAAARRVAEGAEAAVPAIRAFQREAGAEAIPVALVEAVADRAGDGDLVLQLLEDWARDRDFFWRAQALRGLALRAGDPALARRFGALFRARADDPAWLVRVHARHGALRAARAVSPADGSPADGPPAFPPDPDPRARTRLAALEGRPAELLEALGDRRTFLGDPWGRRRATEAFAALKEWAGTDCGYRPDEPFAANADAIAAWVRLVGDRTGRAPAAVAPFADPETVFAGGIEVRSCRNGDLFLRWTDDGRVVQGLEAEPPVALGEASWQELRGELAALALPPQCGVVICDTMRFVPGAGREQSAVAPDSLPAAAAEWLKQLAAAIEEAGNRELADALRDRLSQFAAG